MASLGIGLGGFVDGFRTGYGIRQQQAQDQRAQEEYDYQKTQRDRTTKEQSAVDAIEAQGRADFQQGVNSGQYKPEDFDEFFSSFILPKMKNEMLLDGDTEGAARLQQWGDSAGARKGSRLFASAMMKAQSGDTSGALDDAIKAGQVQGYLSHDMSFDGKEEIKDANGNVVGYRISMKDGKGNEVQQDVAVDDVPRVIATFANPTAAWQTQMEVAATEKKRREDLADYQTKKEIDLATSNQTLKDRQEAIKSLREQSKLAITNGSDVTPFDQLAADDKEKAIQNEIALQRGTRPPAAPTPQLLVDNQTGQQIGGTTGITGAVPTPDTQQAAPGAAPQAAGINPAVASPAPAPAPAAPPPAAQLTNDQATRLSAATGLMQRGDIDGARRLLSDSGVPVSSWPSALQPQPTNPQAVGLALPGQ